jgi:hypothetical protein
VGRTSNRDAEVTPASLGIADNDKRLISSLDQAGAETAIGRPSAALETSGKDDMKTSGFQGTQGRDQALGRILNIRLLFAFLIVLLSGEVVKHIKINCRTGSNQEGIGTPLPRLRALL